MADIITAGRPGKRKLQIPRVDLTPMVDLGFLLVSFFVFTNTLFESKALSLFLPKDDGPPSLMAASGAVTLIAQAGHIYYYEGMAPATPGQATLFNAGDLHKIRTLLLQKKHQLMVANGNDDKLAVLIKPGSSAEMGQLVDLLDEMTICGIKRYSLGEMSEKEALLFP